MTEAEWVTCTDPSAMLHFLRARASDRKLRLFAIACCRRIWHLLNDPSRGAIQVTERFLDGSASREETVSAVRAIPPQPSTAGAAALSKSSVLGVWSAFRLLATAVANTIRHASGPGWRDPAIHAQAAAKFACDLAFLFPSCSVHALAVGASWYAALAAGDEAFDGKRGGDVESNRKTAELRERQIHCELLREIIGDPFRPAGVQLAGPRSPVISLAQNIYAERLFNQMPVLSEALEKAGCTDVGVLQHCRQPRDHVRGCWVLDLLLAKE